jgi:hypothetical protein
MTTDASRRAAARSAELDGEIARHPERFRVLTGDRPTGPLHLGHWFGTLANRVRLQRAGVDVLVLVADYQVVTDRDDPGDLPAAVTGLLLDQLAAGLDPDRTTFFRHSAVPALNQLMLPFLSLVTVAELQRNPTVKAEREATGTRPMSGLLLTYPVHQAADILSCGGNLVPVGRDQLPHLELTRTIARRFDQRYGPVFAEPEALLSSAPLLLGTDGAKMSKSRGNLVFVSRLRGDGVDPMAIRLALLSGHYRTDRAWTADLLRTAEERLATWRRAAALTSGAPAAPVLQGLRDRLADDLDSPGAIALVDAWASATLAGPADAEDEAPRIVCDAVDALLGVALGDCG